MLPHSTIGEAEPRPSRGRAEAEPRPRPPSRVCYNFVCEITRSNVCVRRRDSNGVAQAVALPHVCSLPLPQSIFLVVLQGKGTGEKNSSFSTFFFNKDYL